MKVALYARVSTPDQTVENQLRSLWRYCEAREWQVHREYVDAGVSGAKASRPELELLMTDAVARKFKAVLVWKFDRFFRSTQHMLEALSEFKALEIDFVSLTEAIDTTTPAGKFFFTMLAAMGEFERDLIRERTRAGMDRARAAGKHIGRPRRPVDAARVRALREGANGALGHSFRQISKIMGVPLSSVHAAIGSSVPKGQGQFPNGRKGLSVEKL